MSCVVYVVRCVLCLRVCDVMQVRFVTGINKLHLQVRVRPVMEVMAVLHCKRNFLIHMRWPSILQLE